MIVFLFVPLFLTFAAGQQQQVCFNVTSPRLARTGQHCGVDWDCGLMPYVQCKGGLQDCNYQVNGIAADDAYVYYAQICRSDYGNTAYTVKKVPASGGNPVTLPIVFNYENLDWNIPELIWDIYNHTLYYTYSSQILTVDLQTFEFGPPIGSGIGYFENAALDFDKTNKLTYTCVEIPTKNYTYNIYRYNGILGQGSNVTRTYLYTIGSPCLALRSQENSDYFYVASIVTNQTVRYSRMHRGSKSCVSCHIQPTLLFTLVYDDIYDFVIVGDHFFINTEHGVFYYDFHGNLIKQISSSDTVRGIQYVNGSVVWNENMDLYSVNATGGNLRRVTYNLGTCTCSSGFTGDFCTACNGQVQWNNPAASPLCVAIGENGYPLHCLHDFQCKNLPWATCNAQSSCVCQSPDFIFPQCNQCTNSSQTIHWRNGTPYCA